MAWGDWVRSAVGAVRRGVRDIAAAALSTGASLADVRRQLSETFPRLSGQIISGFVTSASNARKAVVSRFQREATSGLPAYEYQIDTQQPAPFRYLVQVTINRTDDEEPSVSQHWIDSQEPLNYEQIKSRAGSRMDLLLKSGNDTPPGLEGAVEVAESVEYNLKLASMRGEFL